MTGQILLKDYISRDALAKELRVTTRTLERWAWLRKGPPRIKIGSRVFYPIAEAEVWVQEQVRRNSLPKPSRKAA